MDCVFSSPGANKIRVIAIVCIVVAILQLAFAAAAASVVAEEIVGSWWCGLTILLTCILTGLKATNMCSVVCAIIFGIISIVLACVATFIDSVLAAHFDDLEACFGGGKAYGTNTAAAQSCALYNPQYSCVCTDNDYYYSDCWGYDIHDDFDCGYLLDEVPSNLGLSALFAGISIVTTIVFSCIACAVTCCPTSCGHYDPNFAETPPVQQQQQQMVQQQGVPVYQGQPQGGVPMQQGQVMYQQNPQVQGQVMYQQNPQVQGQVYQQNQDPSAMK